MLDNINKFCIVAEMTQRPIKFRIWDNQRQNFLSPDDSSLHCQSNWFIDPFSGKVVDVIGMPENNFSLEEIPDTYYRRGGKIIREARFIIQQFTGLLDKEGKEIYEGDILKSEDGWSEIIFFSEKRSAWVLGDMDDCIDTVMAYEFVANSTVCYLEVVGNIFENPELLEKCKN